MRELKMYIAVKEEVPSQMVPVLVAHAVLGNDMRMSEIKNFNKLENYSDWMVNSFKKKMCY